METKQLFLNLETGDLKYNALGSKKQTIIRFIVSFQTLWSFKEIERFSSINDINTENAGISFQLIFDTKKRNYNFEFVSQEIRDSFHHALKMLQEYQTQRMNGTLNQTGNQDQREEQNRGSRNQDLHEQNTRRIMEESKSRSQSPFKDKSQSPRPSGLNQECFISGRVSPLNIPRKDSVPLTSQAVNTPLDQSHNYGLQSSQVQKKKANLRKVKIKRNNLNKSSLQVYQDHSPLIISTNDINQRDTQIEEDKSEKIFKKELTGSFMLPNNPESAPQQTLVLSQKMTGSPGKKMEVLLQKAGQEEEKTKQFYFKAQQAPVEQSNETPSKKQKLTGQSIFKSMKNKRIRQSLQNTDSTKKEGSAAINQAMPWYKEEGLNLVEFTPVQKLKSKKEADQPNKSMKTTDFRRKPQFLYEIDVNEEPIITNEQPYGECISIQKQGRKHSLPQGEREGIENKRKVYKGGKISVRKRQEICLDEPKESNRENGFGHYKNIGSDFDQMIDKHKGKSILERLSCTNQNIFNNCATPQKDSQRTIFALPNQKKNLDGGWFEHEDIKVAKVKNGETKKKSSKFLDHEQLNPTKNPAENKEIQLVDDHNDFDYVWD